MRAREAHLLIALALIVSLASLGYFAYLTLVSTDTGLFDLKKNAKQLSIRVRAEMGDPAAESVMGAYYYHGLHDTPKNYVQAAKWLRKSAEKGDQEAQYNLATLYYYGQGVSKNDELAAAWYRKAAEQGFTPAEISMGYAYRDGWGVEQDYTQAYLWFEKAAIKGDAGAQSQVGSAYELGHGVEKNYAKAIEWYRKAADQHDAYGQMKVAYMYFTAEDYDNSRRWALLAAAQNNADAEHLLGYMCLHGLGVEQDCGAAYTWYRRAAEHGHKKAAAVLAKMPSLAYKDCSLK